MISLRMESNLNKVIDYINTMPIEIEQIISESIEKSNEDLNIKIYELLGGGYEDIVINVYYNNGSYTISIDNINEYQMYNATGIGMEELLDYVENIILDNVQNGILKGGY